ncbi:MAG: thioredoxin domain-containing protein, partial [Gammaproteobacteria bacterium]
PATKEPVDAVAAATITANFRAQAMAMADSFHGGFGDGPKFPSVPQLVALIELDAHSPDAETAEFIADTLDKMAARGLRDRLGGGFFRYTVDVEWRVPHFEKMLYDNAQLARAYLRAAEVYDNDRWRLVAFDTLDFMRRELWRDTGAFIASLSAVDADDVEGGYYLWTDAELDRLLDSQERTIARLSLGFGGPSALEHGMLPTDAAPATQVAERLKLSVQAAQTRIDSIVGKLNAERERRNLPVDDKLLAGWNGLALSALSAAVRAPDGQRFAASAEPLGHFLTDRLWNGKTLSRAARAGGSAALEDYALVARGLVDWYMTTQAMKDLETDNSRLLEVALDVARRALDDFHSDGGWRLGAGSLIPMAPGEALIGDVSLPSASATLLGAALDAARLAGDSAFEQRVLAIVSIGSERLQQAPYLYATQVTLLNGSANRR